MELQAILFLSLLAFFTHALAASRHFFSLPPSEALPKRSLLPLVLLSFTIYLSSSFILAPLLALLLKSIFPEISSIVLICTLQVLLSIFTALCFFAITFKFRSQIFPIWKRTVHPPHSIIADLGMGVLTWIISLPLVILISKLSDLFIEYVFHAPQYEQAAVRFLKMTLSKPACVVMATFAILILAPVIEEFLFRGLLQTWLKTRWGTKSAILIASGCFAAFHLSASQGTGNISLFISLFVLGCYLGFIYEKQGSLFASIGLHATFNAISTLQILLE